MPKLITVELAKSGMAQVVVYQHKKPLSIKTNYYKSPKEEAKGKKLGIWSKQN